VFFITCQMDGTKSILYSFSPVLKYIFAIDNHNCSSFLLIIKKMISLLRFLSHKWVVKLFQDIMEKDSINKSEKSFQYSFVERESINANVYENESVYNVFPSLPVSHCQQGNYLVDWNKTKEKVGIELKKRKK
jgi:type II secretory pathway component PulC